MPIFYDANFTMPIFTFTPDYGTIKALYYSRRMKMAGSLSDKLIRTLKPVGEVLSLFRLTCKNAEAASLSGEGVNSQQEIKEVKEQKSKLVKVLKTAGWVLASPVIAASVVSSLVVMSPIYLLASPAMIGEYISRKRAEKKGETYVPYEPESSYDSFGSSEREVSSSSGGDASSIFRDGVMIKDPDGSNTLLRVEGDEIKDINGGRTYYKIKGDKITDPDGSMEYARVKDGKITDPDGSMELGRIANIK